MVNDMKEKPRGTREGRKNYRPGKTGFLDNWFLILHCLQRKWRRISNNLSYVHRIDPEFGIHTAIYFKEKERTGNIEQGAFDELI